MYRAEALMDYPSHLYPRIKQRYLIKWHFRYSPTVLKTEAVMIKMTSMC